MLIRKGTPQDLNAVFELIYELAVFEEAPQEVSNSPEKMLEEFDSYHFFVAEDDGKVVGVALYFFSYSTWKGRSLYLDDIVVTQSRRREKIGSQLFEAVLNEAKVQKVGKMHWQVLDWNLAAIEFYKKYQTEFDSQWINCKIYPR
jgi:GNAT superfamily N-acetyltransferase